MPAKLSWPLIGAAVVTAGALLFQLGRKPEPRPQHTSERMAAAGEKALLERLRDRGF